MDPILPLKTEYKKTQYSIHNKDIDPIVQSLCEE